MPPPPVTQNGWHNTYGSQHGSPAGLAAVHSRVAEVMDVDKEDGEVSESDKTPKRAEQATAQPAIDNSSNFRPHFVTNEFGSGYSAAKQPPQSDALSNGTSLPASRAGHVDNMSQLIAERRRETLDFILFLKRANIGYDSVSKEVSHFERHLRDAYDELGISSAGELKLITSSLEERLEVPQSSSQKVPGASQAPDALAATEASKSIDTVSRQPGTSDRAHSDKAANPAVSRETYIQRLLAAKSSKAAASAATRSTSGSVPASPAEKPAASQDSRSVDKEEGKISASILPTPVTKDGTDASATSTAAAMAEQKRKTQTELAKKKMEALRASTAARRANAEHTAPGERPLSGNGEISMANTPFLPTAGVLPQVSLNAVAGTTSLGGLPGLFIATSSPTESSHVHAPTAQHQPGRTATPGKAKKRPVAADFDDMEIEPTETASKRPFGQARHEYADEPMVIEVSDDETVDSTKGHDADDGRAISRAVDSVTTSGSTLPRTVRPGLPTLTNFPAAPDFSQPDSLTASAAQTPSGLATPGAAAKEEELKRKHDQIQALKAKIAAAQQKRRQEQQMSNNQVASSQPQQPSGSLASASSTAIAAPAASGIAGAEMTTKERTAEVARAIDLGTPQRTIGSSLISPSPGPASSDPVWRKRRRQEIESGLPALDASLASNNFKLAQMKLEMQRLEAENQQRIADKQNLIRELENLGIDTEGMPHEELQAKKDEIMQAVDEVVDAAGALNAGHMGGPSPSQQAHGRTQTVATGEAQDADGGVSLNLAQDDLERPQARAELPATVQVAPVLAEPTIDLPSHNQNLREDRIIDAVPTRRDSGEATDGLGDDMDLSDADSDNEDGPEAPQVAQPLPEVTQLGDDTASTVQDNESLDDVYSPDPGNDHVESNLDPSLEAADESEYNPLTPSAADESEFNPENDGPSVPTATAAEIMNQDSAPATGVEDEEEYEPSEDGEIEISASPSQRVEPSKSSDGIPVVPGSQAADQNMQDALDVEADAVDEYEPVEEASMILQQDDGAARTDTAVAPALSAPPHNQVDEIKLDIPDAPEILSETERPNEPTSATGSNTPASSVAPLTFVTDDLAPELIDVQEDVLAHAKLDSTPSSHVRFSVVCRKTLTSVARLLASPLMRAP